MCRGKGLRKENQEGHEAGGDSTGAEDFVLETSQRQSLGNGGKNLDQLPGAESLFKGVDSSKMPKRNTLRRTL